MPSQTDELGLPYPLQGDVIDVAGDVQLLAEAVDPAIKYRAYEDPSDDLIDGTLWPTAEAGALAYAPDADRPFVGIPQPGLWLRGRLWWPLLQVDDENGDISIIPGDYQSQGGIASFAVIADNFVVDLTGGVTAASANFGQAESVKLPNWSTSGSSRVNVVASQDDENRLMPDPGSSQRVKEHISPITPEERDSVLRLEGVTFRYKYPNWRAEDAGGDTEFGLVAERVAAVDPRLAKYGPQFALDSDGELITDIVEIPRGPRGELRRERRPVRVGDRAVPVGVEYERIVPLLVEKVKELEERLAVLECA